jgi:cellulose synthase/poly-beta-1,6-N-acetylglucosamine synthase-like glycosyltransferase
MALLAAAAVLLAMGASIAGGYLLWLLLPERRSRVERTLGEQPAVLIVVPVFDEAPLIAGKLANLAELQYPPEQRRVVLVDGGSSDGTLEILVPLVAANRGFELLRTRHRNKTAQILAALHASTDEEWVLVTDADARLAPDTLQQLLSVVSADEAIGVVGAHVMPRDAHALESLHWRFADWLRERECARGSAAIVTAPCYLTERRFLANMPDDALADDIHVACSAMLAGRRVGHAAASVLELRSPQSVSALLRHKFRKADAYLREIFRFLPEAHRMKRPMRAMFLWRAALLTLLPLAAVMALLVAAAAMVSGSATPSFETAGGAAMIVLLAAAFPQGRRVLRFGALATLLTAVSAAALLRYPFSRQTASFPKIVSPSDHPLYDEFE